MGYSQDLFLDSGLNEEFICSICQNVLEDPVMLSCEHTFCRLCITNWCMQCKPASCPIDRKRTDISNDLKSPTRLFLNLLNGLKLHCQFHPLGCNSIITLGDLKSHEEKCKANPDFTSPCPSDCGAWLKKVEIETHSCVGYLKNKIQSLENKVAELHDESNATASKLESLLKQLQIETLNNSVGNLRCKIYLLEKDAMELETQINLAQVPSTNLQDREKYFQEKLALIEQLQVKTSDCALEFELLLGRKEIDFTINKSIGDLRNQISLLHKKLTDNKDWTAQNHIILELTTGGGAGPLKYKLKE